MRYYSTPTSKITDTCQRCGREFTYKRRIPPRQFCSRACYTAARTQERVVQQCPECGVEFELLASRVKAGRTYCSELCGGLARRVPLAERFWTKVDKTVGCWLWTAYCDDGGYGVVGRPGGQLDKAHRVAWELTYGPIPLGLHVLHNCPGGDNPACVCPEHLWLGTHSDNMRDAVAKGRKGKSGGTFQPGHPYHPPRV